MADNELTQEEIAGLKKLAEERGVQIRMLEKVLKDLQLIRGGDNKKQKSPGDFPSAQELNIPPVVMDNYSKVAQSINKKMTDTTDDIKPGQKDQTKQEPITVKVEQSAPKTQISKATSAQPTQLRPSTPTTKLSLGTTTSLKADKSTSNVAETSKAVTQSNPLDLLKAYETTTSVRGQPTGQTIKADIPSASDVSLAKTPTKKASVPASDERSYRPLTLTPPSKERVEKAFPEVPTPKVSVNVDTPTVTQTKQSREKVGQSVPQPKVTDTTGKTPTVEERKARTAVVEIADAVKRVIVPTLRKQEQRKEQTQQQVASAGGSVGSTTPATKKVPDKVDTKPAEKLAPKAETQVVPLQKNKTDIPVETIKQGKRSTVDGPVDAKDGRWRDKPPPVRRTPAPKEQIETSIVRPIAIKDIKPWKNRLPKGDDTLPDKRGGGFTGPRDQGAKKDFSKVNIPTFNTTVAKSGSDIEFTPPVPSRRTSLDAMYRLGRMKFNNASSKVMGFAGVGDIVGGAKQAIGSERAGNIGGGLAQMGAGGAMALGAMGVPGMQPVAGVMMFGKALAESVEKLRDWGNKLHDSNMQFAEFSASMGRVQAESEFRQIQISQDRGERRAESAGKLAESKDKLDRALAPMEDKWAEFKNSIMAGVLDKLGDIATAVNKLFGIAEDAKDTAEGLDYAGFFKQTLSDYENIKEGRKPASRPDRFPMR